MAKMEKNCLPNLTSCCGVMSVKAGTYCIAIFNQVSAVIGFVSYVSGIIISTNNIHREDDPLSKFQIYSLINIASGIFVTAAHIAMGLVLTRGLIKEESRYLRCYLLIGSGVITLNVIIIGCTVFFVHWLTIFPTFFAMAMEVYFMLVIRSAYREMVVEEKAFVAARNNLSRGENVIREI